MALALRRELDAFMRVLGEPDNVVSAMAALHALRAENARLLSANHGLAQESWGRGQALAACEAREHAARVMLTSLEWCGVGTLRFGASGRECPVCCYRRPEHADFCTLSAAISAAPSSVDALREFGERVARIAIVEGDRTHTGAGDERDPEEVRQRAETIVARILSPEGKVTP